MEVSKARSDHALMGEVHNSLIPELNIYNQAHIELSEPIQKIMRNKIVEQADFNVHFHVGGELEGEIITSLTSLSDEPMSMNRSSSIFLETMNILVGRVLTNLEVESDLFCYIQSSHIGTHNTPLEIQASQKWWKLIF